MGTEIFETDCVVIGAGVVGLAVARSLALRGREVLVLERNAVFGEETSARNSEVIHAGLAYAAGSLKARLCIEGKAQLYAFCAARGVPHKRLGKLIVATRDAELPALDRTIALAEGAGLFDLEPRDKAAVAAMEPELTCVAALWSPSTGVIDSHAFMLALLGEAEAQGTTFVPNSRVAGGRVLGDGRIELDIGGDEPMRLHAAHVINCAGLWAQQVAGCIDGIPGDSIPGQVLAKGSYFSLSQKAPFRHLVYPAPPGDGSLGVHLTLDMAGRAKFGPDIERLDCGPDAVDYRVDPGKAGIFTEAVRRFWPGLPDGALVPDYAGCRPKLAAGDAGQIDFRLDGAEVHGLEGHVMCYGLESPALTSALAIAEVVADKALGRPAA